MAEISITAQNVVPSANANFINVYACAQNTTQMQPVWLNVTSSLWELASANGNTHGAALGTQLGVAVSESYTGQPLSVCTTDLNLACGGNLVQGTAYVVSPNAGKFMPVDDLTNTDFRISLGIAFSNVILSLSPFTTGTNT